MAVVYDKEQIELLRKSVEQVGHLQDVLVDAETGQVLVGRHRIAADPHWPTRRINVKDDLLREIIIIDGNKRRTVSKEETEFRFLRVAKILETRGTPKEKVCAEMSHLLGYDGSYIRQILPSEYKMTSKDRTQESALLVAQIPEEAGPEMQSKTALDSLGKNPDQIFYPFKDCKCPDCHNQNKCY